MGNCQDKSLFGLCYSILEQKDLWSALHRSCQTLKSQGWLPSPPVRLFAKELGVSLARTVLGDMWQALRPQNNNSFKDFTFKMFMSLCSMSLYGDDHGDAGQKRVPDSLNLQVVVRYPNVGAGN